ncbi:uncharacterized protein LOC128873620 [Hylaeus volcanicus]|uniref:uncharacterized protein LOC128873620 n=1 Tax=Hylaeus volcanicus TaxID=313075 RepID=UPI0023B80106|nr:uncharacterized protein LOC128873620 [Hylaeus volcanicus]
MANKLAERIKYAMAHLSHKQYISLLARPNWRRTQRMNMNVLINPFSIRRAALKARASKRIRVMARPKHVNKKYDPALAPPPYPRIHPKTLEATISKRIIDLALPKKRHLLANMRYQTSPNIAELLSKVQNSRYRKYRYFCNVRIQREMRQKQRIMAKLRRAVKPEDWDQHMAFLKKLAAPKVPPRPTFPARKRKWRPANMRRIEELATPLVREMPEVRDPFEVPQSALTYIISKRIESIAYPKTPPVIIPPKIPGAVRRAALKAIASPRIVLLATPAQRPAGMETDLREDAFKVSPKALKAKCSRRLKFLAKPKRYR